MPALTGRVFRVQSGELGLVFSLGLLLLANALALNVADVVAVSGFLTQVGASQILLVWTVDMLLIILVTGLYSLIVDRFERLRLMRALVMGFALPYLGLRLLFALDVPEWLSYALLYLTAEQQWLFFPLVFWVLANDVFDLAQAKRLFTLIASLGLLGRVLGLGLAAGAPPMLDRLHLSPAELLTVNASIYLAVLPIMVLGLRKVRLRQARPRRASLRETLTEGWGFVRDVPSFRYLTLVLVAVSLVLTVVEFHFLVVANAVFDDLERFQTFYGLFYLTLTVVAIAIQALLASRLIEKVTLKNSFLLVPGLLLAGSVTMFALPGLAGVVLGFGVPYLAKDTVDNSARKAFQALVPAERRGRVSLFMDSYLYAAGTLLGCCVAGAVVLIGTRLGPATDIRLTLALAAGGAGFALWASARLRAAYDSSLLNWRLKRRRRRAGVLEQLDL